MLSSKPTNIASHRSPDSIPIPNGFMKSQTRSNGNVNIKIFTGELITFYTIFYIALAALFAICMKSLLVTIDEHTPKWTLSESLIGTNPGLGFRPMSHNVDQGSLIWYDASNQTQIGYWVTLLDDFLKGL